MFLSAVSHLGSVSGGIATARVLAESVVTASAVLIFAGVQIAACHGRDRRCAAFLLLVLGLLPLTWGVPSSALAYGYASALVLFSARAAATAIAGCGVLFAVLFRGGQVTSVSMPMVLFELLIAAIVLAAITHLAVLANRLRLARELLARRHVDLERERIGRHLHDVLGRTLVAASLRNQTILRTIGERCPRVSAELQGLQETIVTGQQRVRAVTSGPAITSWSDEVSAARMLCRRVGIDLDADVSAIPPPAHRAVVGLAIRESVTNVLKHSRATRIDLAVTSRDAGTTIRVVNDGVRHTDWDGPRVSRLRTAVEQADGTLTMGVLAGNHYRVEIALPAATARAGVPAEPL